MNIRNENGILIDDNGNRATISLWGSEESARKSLENLRDCFRCSDCVDCYRSSDCHRCFDCFDCHRCFRCHRCFDCHRCADCHRCSDCFDCRRRFDCSDMSPVPLPDVPVIEGIHRKVFDACSAPGALKMDQWRTCETTHCRAGWVVHLAGEAGYELESRTSTLFAAQRIYLASGYSISPIRFYDSNEQALDDMRVLAEQESAQCQC